MQDSTSAGLLDGAVGSTDLTEDLEWCRKIAADASRPLDERLEAYEDLIASEVGDTQLTRAPAVSGVARSWHAAGSPPAVSWNCEVRGMQLAHLRRSPGAP